MTPILKLGELPRPAQRGLRLPPEDGWKPSTWYVVRVAYRRDNPNHDALLFTGFLNADKTPGGYHCIIPAIGMATWRVGAEAAACYDDPFCLEAIREVWDTNESKGVKTDET